MQVANTRARQLAMLSHSFVIVIRIRYHTIIESSFHCVSGAHAVLLVHLRVDLRDMVGRDGHGVAQKTDTRSSTSRAIHAWHVGLPHIARGAPNPSRWRVHMSQSLSWEHYNASALYIPADVSRSHVPTTAGMHATTVLYRAEFSNADLTAI